MSTVDVDRPKRRSQRAETAILDATLELLGELGFAGLSIDGIAARAGVGKATIYRHWDGKAHLVIDAFRRSVPEMVEPDTGSLREDLYAILRRMAEHLGGSCLAPILPSLIDAAERDPELRRLHGEFSAERRAKFARVLERGRARGELGPDVDLELAIDLLTGPIFTRRLITRKPLTRAYAIQLVDALLPVLAG